MASPSLGPRRKVLFVEDESTLRRTYKRFFADRYHLAFAASGTEARRQLDEFHPEVLVLDLRLPDTDGITLLQEIRRSQPALPVIVTTSYVSMEPLINVLDLGHSGYLRRAAARAPRSSSSASGWLIERTSPCGRCPGVWRNARRSPRP